MRNRNARLAPALAVAALALASCGGGSSSETSAAPAVTEPATQTTSPAGPTAPPSTLAATTTVAPTTTEAAVTFASLTEYQREIVGGICAAAAEPAGATIGDVWRLEVAAGYSGVPELEAAWVALGADGSDADLLAAASPICADLGWASSAVPAPTTTRAASQAFITIEVGELYLENSVGGCPMDEISAGEYWIASTSEPWLTADGEELEVRLSVDATAADLGWSFSITNSPSRLISSSQRQTLEADLAPRLAVFSTVFDDQLASISGGWPDTPGTVTITCST